MSNPMKQRYTLQQRCVHHINSLLVRNLTLSLQSDAASLISSTRQLLYFTLHPITRGDQSHISDNNEIFTSERIRYCCYPTWSNINIPVVNFVKFTEFIMRLWIGAEDSYLPALQWNISLSALNCIGDSLDNEKLKYHSNAFVLAMHGRYYSSSSSVTVKPPFQSLQAYDFSDAKNSCSVFALHRLLSSKKSTQLYKNRISFMREKSKKLFGKREEVCQLELEFEELSNRIKHVRKLLEREQNILRLEKERALAFKLQLDNQETEAKEKQKTKLEEISKFDKDHEASIETKLEVSQLVKQLGLRRRDILSELSHMFPISCRKNDHRALKKPLIDRVYTICSIKLPESENFVQKEDTATSVALGYTAQLLSMMSQFLLVPLRYPVSPKGSQSFIVDHVTEKLLDRERMFPLHVKGNKDRFVSEYGVFLLNKNVAQLRYYCGLGTTDLRPTLENVKTLLEERLGAKSGAIGHHSQPIDIYNPNREPMKSEKARSRSPGDVPMPSANALSSLGGDFAANLKASQSDILTSPRRMRIGNRHSELQSLRGELFGSSDRLGAHRKSPKEYQNNPSVAQTDPADTHVKSLSTLPKPSGNIDSIESMNSNPSPIRAKFTGLEEIGQSGHSKKLPYSSARAELLGKRANQLSNDPAARRGWSATRPLTGGLMEKRSQLFRKRDLHPKESFVDENFDTANSHKSSSSAGSAHSSILPGESPPYMDTINLHNNLSNFSVSTHSNLNDKSPFSNDIEEPEVSIIDPSKSHLTIMDQSVDELDLC